MERNFGSCGAVWLLLGLSTAAAAGAEVADAPPSPTEIAQWVRQLDDASFSVRQAAHKQLAKAGRAAIEAVTQAAVGGSLEVTDRSIRILLESASSDDLAASGVAIEALAKIASAGDPRASVRARSAMQTYQLRIASMLERIGATFGLRDGRIVAVDFDAATELGSNLRLLHALPDLEDLSFSTHLMDDRGVAELRGLPKVRNINLYRSRVGDTGLQHLKTLPSLRRIPMGETRVTDKGLAHLKEMTQLEYIGLRGDQITDAGLVELKGLPNLKGLHLGETEVTDAGLEHLRSLKSLEYVELWTTPVTEAGLARLSAAMPQLQIRMEPR